MIVGLSGGVDSAVTAYLLKKEGHDVHAVFMKNWEEDDRVEHCPATQDIADAQAVAAMLNIPFEVINFSEQYWERVFEDFLTHYRNGRTPNPDVLCNKEIKFKAFLNYAQSRDADLIATGHYARIQNKNNLYFLTKARDLNKDQSYFLYLLDQTQLAASCFPLSGFSKQEVRQIAASLNFPNHAKKDSTGICFIGERKFRAFLNEYLPFKPGEMVTSEGEILGEHVGLTFYTIGQRQGLAIGGRKGKADSPWYVADKDFQKNRLVVVQGENHPALFKKEITASQLHWITITPKLPTEVTAKTRYRQADQRCWIKPLTNPKTVRVTFDVPQRALTPGQSIVFYQDDICLGGGIIENESI